MKNQRNQAPSKTLQRLSREQEDEKGKWSKEYQNVKLAEQDPALFEVPAGYQKIDLGGMFKIR